MFEWSQGPMKAFQEVLRRLDQQKEAIDQQKEAIDQQKEALENKVIPLIEEHSRQLGPLIHDRRYPSLVSEESAKSWTKKSEKMREDMIHYYNVKEIQGEPCCMVLSSLYPDMCVQVGRWNKIEAVIEHVFLKREENCAETEWDLDVWAPQNGLFLLRDLERTFHAGLWTLHPEPQHDEAPLRTYKFKIHVAECIWRRELTYHDETVDWQRRKRVLRNGKPLRFQELHQKTVTFHGKPFLRALWVKAVKAHEKYKDLPDPRTVLQNFLALCDALQQEQERLRRVEEFFERGDCQYDGISLSGAEG